MDALELHATTPATARSTVATVHSALPSPHADTASVHALSLHADSEEGTGLPPLGIATSAWGVVSPRERRHPHLSPSRVLADARDAAAAAAAAAGVTSPETAKPDARVKKEQGWDSRFSRSALPLYDALSDSHCTYVRSPSFQSSPYMTQVLRGSKASRSPTSASLSGTVPEALYRGSPSNTPSPSNNRRKRAPRRRRPSSSHSRRGPATEESPLQHAARDVASRCASVREGIKLQLQDCMNDPDAQVAVLDMVASLRNATVAAVEAVCAWRAAGGLPEWDTAEPGAGEPEFVFNGGNYLLVMARDLDFLAGSTFLMNLFRGRLVHNPLLVPPEGANPTHGIDWPRVVDALRVIVGEERRYGRPMSAPAKPKSPAKTRRSPLPPPRGVLAALGVSASQLSTTAKRTVPPEDPTSKFQTTPGVVVPHWLARDTEDEGVAAAEAAVVDDLDFDVGLKRLPIPTMWSIVGEQTGITKDVIASLMSYKNPPEAVLLVVQALRVALADHLALPAPEELEWKGLLRYLRDTRTLLSDIIMTGPKDMKNPAKAVAVKLYLDRGIADPDNVAHTSTHAAAVCKWLVGLVERRLPVVRDVLYGDRARGKLSGTDLLQALVKDVKRLKRDLAMRWRKLEAEKEDDLLELERDHLETDYRLVESVEGLVVPPTAAPATVNVHVSLPPPGTAFSSTYVAEPPEGGTTTADIPVVYLTAELEAVAPPGPADTAMSDAMELGETVDLEDLRASMRTTATGAVSAFTSGKATVKAIRGLQAPFATKTNPDEAPLRARVLGADLATLLTSVDWIKAGAALRQTAVDTADFSFVPPRPRNEVTRQSYEPRPWDWEQAFSLPVMQRAMLRHAATKLRLVNGADGPMSAYLPNVVDCGTYALDLAKFNAMRRLRAFRKARRQKRGAAQSTVGALLGGGDDNEEEEEEDDDDVAVPLNLPPKRTLGRLFARQEGGSLYLQFREVCTDVPELVEAVDSEDDEPEDAVFVDGVLEVNGAVVHPEGDLVAMGPPDTPPAASPESQAGGREAAAPETTSSPRTPSPPAPSSAGSPSSPSVPTTAEASAAAADAELPEMAGVDVAVVTTRAFWRLAAVAEKAVPPVFSRRLKRIPLAWMEDEDGEAMGETRPLFDSGEDVDTGQVFGVMAETAMMAGITRRCYLEQRRAPGAAPSAQWSLKVNTLLVERVAQISGLAMSVAFHAMNDGMLLKASPVVVADPLPGQPQPPKLVYELALGDKHLRALVTHIVVSAGSDSKRAALLRTAHKVAARNRLVDPVLAVVPEGSGEGMEDDDAPDLGEVHMEEGGKPQALDSVVDVLLQPRFTAQLCSLVLQELVILDHMGAPVMDMADVEEPRTLKLRTVLHQDSMEVPVAVRNSNRRSNKQGVGVPMLLGSIEISPVTTLEEVRWLLSKELDKVSLPKAFRFEFQGVPCARRQEGRRRAVDCMPFKPEKRKLLTEVSIASFQARKVAAVAAASRDPTRAPSVPTQDDRWAIFLVPVPRPPKGFNRKLFASGWASGVPGRAAAQAANGVGGARAGGDFGDGLSDGGSSSDEDVWQGPQTEEHIRPLHTAYAITTFGKRHVELSQDLRGIITAGDVVQVGEERCKVRRVVAASMTLQDPYMGGFTGKELRLKIIETVVKGQEVATDAERMTRLDPVRDGMTAKFFRLKVAMEPIKHLVGATPLNAPDVAHFVPMVKPEVLLKRLFPDVCKWTKPTKVVTLRKWSIMCLAVPKLMTADLAPADVERVFTESIEAAVADAHAARLAAFKAEVAAEVAAMTEEERNNPLRKKRKPPKGPARKSVMDAEVFRDYALPALAELRYPMMTKRQAMKEVLLEHLALWPTAKDLLWGEAVRLSVVQEARHHAAAMRMQAMGRAWKCRRELARLAAAATKIQSVARYRQWWLWYKQQLAIKLKRERDSMIAEEAYMREYMRLYAIHCKRMLRWEAVNLAWDREMMRREEGHVWARVAYEAQLQREEDGRRDMEAEDVRSLQLEDAYRLRKAMVKRQAARDKKLRKKGAQLLNEARRLNGELIIIRITRQSLTELSFMCYLPATSLKFQKTITEDMLQGILNRDITLRSYGEHTTVPRKQLYDVGNIQILADQLFYEDRKGRKIIKMSRRGDLAPGRLIFRRGMRFAPGPGDSELFGSKAEPPTPKWTPPATRSVVGTAYIVTVSFFKNNLFVRAFHPPSKATIPFMLPMKTVLQLFGVPPDTRPEFYPGILHPDNRERLGEWLALELSLCRGYMCQIMSHKPLHDAGKPAIMLELIEGQSKLREAMALKLQCWVRMVLAMAKARSLLLLCVEIHFDKAAGRPYYWNRRTKVRSWTKPTLLANVEVKEAPDGWQTIKDPHGRTQYYHARTGRYSYVSEKQAATLMQRMIRRKNQGEFALGDMAEVVRALQFQVKTEFAYKKNPKAFVNIVNMALYKQCITLDLDGARALYETAFEKASKHPVVLTGFAMLRLMTEQYPRAKVWAESQIMLNTARTMDPGLAMMDLAMKHFFHWGVVVNGRSAVARAQYAMAQQAVSDNFDRAEKYYRQAVAMDPTDVMVSLNYDDFLKARLPGGVYEDGGPPVEVKRRAKAIEEMVEYTRFRDDDARVETCRTFLVSKLTGKAMWREPEWETVWEERRARSTREGRVDDAWQLFFDPLLQHEFQYNGSTGEHKWNKVPRK